LTIINFSYIIGQYYRPSFVNQNKSKYMSNDVRFALKPGAIVKVHQKIKETNKKGEEKEVKVKFPAEYSEKELADKEALFKLKVKAVKERDMPKLDDEFAKDLKLDNLAQLKDKVREGIKLEKEAAERARLKKEILEKLIERNSFETPPSLVANYLQSMISRTMEGIKQGKLKVEDPTEATYEKLRDKYAKVAETRAKEEIILDAVAKHENISVTAEELDLKVKQIAQQSYQNFDSLKRQLIEQGTDSILMAEILEDKVFDFIIGKAR